MDMGYGSFSGFSGQGMLETHRFSELSDVKNKPGYNVHIPYGTVVSWPSRCSLCCKPSVVKTKEVKTTFKSGEYGVAKKNTTVRVQGVPYCEDCLKRTSPTKTEGIIALIGLLIGFVIFLAMTMMIPGGWCMGLLMGALFALAFFPVARLFIRNRAEEQPVKLVMGTENKLLGANRALFYKFKFRNLRYAYEFANTNNSLTGGVCPTCKLDLSKGPEAVPFCIKCNKKKP